MPKHAPLPLTWQVEASLNGVDFSASAPAVRFAYYDNWIMPRVRGAPPSPRVLHAAALVGSSWWVFGGLASVFRPGAGWATRRASAPHDALAEGSHELLNDCFELQLRCRSRPPPRSPPRPCLWL